MSTAAVAKPADGADESGGASGLGPVRRFKRLLLIAVPVLALALVGGGLWLTGLLPSLRGKSANPPAAEEVVKATVFVELPELVSNLNSGSKRPAFVKLKVKLELARPEDEALVTQQMPRVLDLLQTYLRETRPDELRGAAGTWRLRRELVARANIAVTPARVNDVLFTEMLVQ